MTHDVHFAVSLDASSHEASAIAHIDATSLTSSFQGEWTWLSQLLALLVHNVFMPLPTDSFGNGIII